MLVQLVPSEQFHVHPLGPGAGVGVGVGVGAGVGVLSLFRITSQITTPITAPPIEGPDAVEQARLLTRYTAPFNLTGLPAISLPCGFDHDGLPIGLQITSGPWEETKVLRAAYAYENATEWHKSHPVLN